MPMPKPIPGVGGPPSASANPSYRPPPPMAFCAASRADGASLQGLCLETETGFEYGPLEQRTLSVPDHERLATFGTAERPLSLEERELSLPFSERVLKPVIKTWSTRLGSRTPDKSADKIKLKLAQAGR